jgi:hypothetical protein
LPTGRPASCPANHGRLRGGHLSARALEQLSDYTPDMLQHEQVVEIWTLQNRTAAGPVLPSGPLLLEDGRHAILPKACWKPPCIPSPPAYCRPTRAEGSFHEMLMQTNSAPMLLIDPADDGRIVNVNQAPSAFMASRAEFTTSTPGKSMPWAGPSCR